MTLKEFFRRARRGRTWHVGPARFGYEVACDDGYCPLGAVARLTGKDASSGKRYPRKRPDPDEAARKLRIAPSWAWRIARAADYLGAKSRPWLLKNLGIEP